MKQVLQIDPEFKRLSVPLSPEEEHKLENSLIRVGCKEPIVVWSGYILDGHKRYAICNYEEIEHEIVEMRFTTREEAIFWSARMKISAVRRESAIYRYLAGKVYLSAKMLVHNHKWDEVSAMENIDLSVKDCGGRISVLVAKIIGSNRTVISRFARYAKDMDLIAEKDGALFDAIISGQIETTYANVTEMAKMDGTKLTNIRRKLIREKGIKLRRGTAREKSGTKVNKKPVLEPLAQPLEMGIKEMPAFDPDMEFRGLTLTIPTWMNAISRSRTKTNVEMVSESTKKQLAENLRRLEEQIMQTLEAIGK